MAISRHTRSDAGFSVIELLVTLAVAAILVAMALPVMRGTLDRTRMATQANDIVAAVALARTESIRRNAVGGICASSNLSTCGGTWSNGWIVWVDANRNNIADAGEALRVGGFSSSDTITASAVAVQFNQRGRRILPAAGNVTLAMKPTTCSAGTLYVARTLTLNLSGGVSIAQTACT